MNKAVSTIFAACAALASAGRAQSQPAPALPAAAQSILRSYDESVESARKLAVQRLTQAMQGETQRGNLQGAMAIQKAIQNLSAAAPHSGISLLDLPVKESSVGWDELVLATPEKPTPRKVLVSGEPCLRFIYAHAPSRVVYAIPPGVKTFTAFGVRTAGDSSINGTLFYVVKIDGKPALQTKPLKDCPDLQVPIQVDVPVGAKEIELIIDAMQDNNHDQGVWALPTFR